MSGVAAFLKERTVGDVIFDKNSVVEVSTETPLDQVLSVLASNNLRSVPVYSQKYAGGDKIYQGLISTFDIVSLVAFSMNEEDNEERAFRSDVDFTSTPVSSVIGQLSEEGKKVWIFEGPDTLLHLCEAFGKGVHRALVHQKDDQTGRVAFRIISQADVVRFFVRHEEQLKPNEALIGALGLPTTKKIWNKTMEELGFCNPLGEVRKLLEISSTDTAIHGFRLMALSSIQALPVLDENKRLVTTLSVADLRGVTHGTLKEVLFSSVLDYLRSVYGSNNTLHPITCKPRDTLWEVLVKLSAAKIHKHQAWITDPDEKVLGVVSLSDILQKVYFEADM